ncbi:CHY zinc finger protein [Corynebacterium breve]|uniref:CHY zinc finger protein n=1 Tax=Corynebacterium breve TaxID=3049799 RepID=A0ABY8VHX7_9CORY|nr:CHY zinc finger protein [Corynebacterium breve]WIM67819.1 CHY zinc finger protein [Corynebacterium breve]
MILGVDVDRQGRCAHWHSDVDVVANKCLLCDDYFACSLCHAALRDHPFGRMPRDAHEAAMCGVCGHTFGLAAYGKQCPSCGQLFNPGCSDHVEEYFLD